MGSRLEHRGAITFLYHTPNTERSHRARNSRTKRTQPRWCLSFSGSPIHPRSPDTQTTTQPTTKPARVPSTQPKARNQSRALPSPCCQLTCESRLTRCNADLASERAASDELVDGPEESRDTGHGHTRRRGTAASWAGCGWRWCGCVRMRMIEKMNLFTFYGLRTSEINHIAGIARDVEPKQPKPGKC